MASFSAISSPIPGDQSAQGREVVIVAYEGVTLLDVAGPAQVFATATDVQGDGGAPAYRVILASRSGGPVMTSTGIAVLTSAFAELAGRPIDTLVVAGGPGVHASVQEAGMIEWVSARAAEAKRTCSVCTGAFLLAAAGLLNGRRATTHWRWAETLQTQYPEVSVEADPIFLRDGSIWTSAGVSAGIDLALALVEEDLGHGIALRVARRLVVFLKRPGSQTQFSAALAAQTRDGGRFGELHAWIAANLGHELRIEHLAEQARMSPRHFARVYAASTGMTPAKAIEAMRVEAARRLLEENGRPIGWVAQHCGFGDDERMRRSFVRWIGVPPTDYRERFRQTLTGADPP
jgi:transcriptional regulator GlxA family with amidase domain